MIQRNILLVEDDPTIARIIRFYLLSKQQFQVTWAETAGDALAYARHPFDIILLDIMLPDVDGIELCTALRKWHQCPIIFITCLDDDETIIRALSLGGDDYLIKPFNNQVLFAKIEANLRRSRLLYASKAENAISCKDFSVLPDQSVVMKSGKTLPLSQTEYRLLTFLMQHPDHVYSSEELYAWIWGADSAGDSRTVSVHIHNLRKKLEHDARHPVHIRSHYGAGYSFSI